MEIKVFCPGCRAVLRVPTESAGKTARCPNCQCRFLIPDQRDVMEDTVSSWIEQDVEDMQDEFEQQMRAKAAEEARKKEERERQKAAKAAEKIEKYFHEAPQQVATTAPEAPPTIKRPGSPATVRPAPPPIRRPGQPVTPTAAPSEPAPPARPDSPVAPTQTPVAQAPPAAPVQAPPPVAPEPVAAPLQPPAPSESPYGDVMSEDEQLLAAAQPMSTDPSLAVDPDEYPSNVFVDPDIPHLVIAGCSQQGVLMAFDASFLQHPGFRVSMPVACVFSGEDACTNLVAKPLAFFDQSGGQIRNALDIESGHECSLAQNPRPEQILSRFGLLPGLPKPFNLPTPYYVVADHRNMSLECHTASREDGGITCYVLIPDGRYALEWLKNVNGVCGLEYRLLTRDVNRLWSEAWGDVSEKIRQRLGTWVGFEPGECFRYYFNDAEFGKKDEGLAGVVLTDRRMIYHKYHRQGEVRYEDSPSLILRPDGDFAGLTLRTDEGIVKVSRFRVGDINVLVQIMRDFGMQVEMRAE